MCAGVEFCGDCHDVTVTAWSDGKTHELPIFGDTSQRYTATRRRSQVIRHLFVEGELASLRSFPEWTAALKLLYFPLNSTIEAVINAVERRRNCEQYMAYWNAPRPKEPRDRAAMVLGNMVHHVRYATSPVHRPELKDQLCTFMNPAGGKQLRCREKSVASGMDILIELRTGDQIEIRGFGRNFARSWKLPSTPVLTEFQEDDDGGHFRFEGGSIPLNSLTGRLRLRVVSLTHSSDESSPVEPELAVA